MMSVYETVMARAIEQVDLKLTPEEIDVLRKEFLRGMFDKIGHEYPSHELAQQRAKLLEEANDETTKSMIRTVLVDAIKAYLGRKRDFDYFMRDILGTIAREEIHAQVVNELNRREHAAKAKAAFSKRMAKSRKAKAL